MDGPFANVTLTLGPKYNLSATPHCLTRNFVTLAANDTYVGPEMISDVLKEKDYFDMIMAMTKTPTNSNPKKFGVHSIGHSGPGGEVCIFSFLLLFSFFTANDSSVLSLTIFCRKQISGPPPTIPSFPSTTPISTASGTCGRIRIQTIYLRLTVRSQWGEVLRGVLGILRWTTCC